MDAAMELDLVVLMSQPLDDRDLTEAEQAEAVILAARLVAETRLSHRLPPREREDAWHGIGDRITEMAVRFGANGMRLLLLGLADTIVIHQWGRAPLITQEGDPSLVAVSPLWMDTTGVLCEDPEKIPPPVRWAGRFVAARAANDRAGCEALLSSLSPGEFGQGLCALLDCCAATLNLIHGIPE